LHTFETATKSYTVFISQKPIFYIQFSGVFINTGHKWATHLPVSDYIYQAYLVTISKN